MFSGNYTAKVDANGRFTFPAKQVSQLGDERKMYAMLGVNNLSIWLMTVGYWQQFVQSLTKGALPFVATDLALKRQFIGNSFETEIENNNRIVIPQTLLDKVKIVENCTVVGVGDFFEIWNPEKFIERELEEQGLREKAVRELGGSSKL